MTLWKQKQNRQKQEKREEIILETIAGIILGYLLVHLAVWIGKLMYLSFSAQRWL